MTLGPESKGVEAQVQLRRPLQLTKVRVRPGGLAQGVPQ
jgi:hypothetical protein